MSPNNTSPSEAYKRAQASYHQQGLRRLSDAEKLTPVLASVPSFTSHFQVSPTSSLDPWVPESNPSSLHHQNSGSSASSQLLQSPPSLSYAHANNGYQSFTGSPEYTFPGSQADKAFGYNDFGNGSYHTRSATGADTESAWGGHYLQPYGNTKLDSNSGLGLCECDDGVMKCCS